MSGIVALNASDVESWPHPTQQKIERLRSLPPGWFYGNGAQFQGPIIDTAQELNDEALRLLLYETDVFPAESGEVMVAVYYGEYCLELTIEANGTISVVLEEGQRELEFQEGVSLSSAKQKMRSFRELAWKQSDLSSESNGIGEGGDSQAWPSEIQAAIPASQSSITPVLSTAAARSVSTLTGSTSHQQSIRRSSGVSARAYFQMASP